MISRAGAPRSLRGNCIKKDPEQPARDHQDSMSQKGYQIRKTVQNVDRVGGRQFALNQFVTDGPTVVSIMFHSLYTLNESRDLPILLF